MDEKRVVPFDKALAYVMAKNAELLDRLAAHAETEYRAGRTRSIEQVAADYGVTLTDTPPPRP